MKKLAKYLKPFALAIIAVIALIFVQTICDLSLPTLMSDIVNVGIQQSGIEHAAPEAVSEDGMRFMRAFMTEGEKELVDESYALVSSNDVTDGKGTRYISIYPDADSQLYVRLETDDETLSRLDSAFGLATWTFIETVSSLSRGSGSENAMPATINEASVDLNQLYAALPALEALPGEVFDAAREKAVANGETYTVASGVAFTKILYSELGRDTAAIQRGYILNVGLKMLLITVLAGACVVVVGFLAARIAAGFAKKVRFDLFSKIEGFSNEEFDRFSSASLITRCTNDITQLQMTLTMGVRMIFSAPIMAIGGIIMALRRAASMSWVIALSCIILICFMAVIMSITLPRFKLVQKLTDKLNLVSRETLSGLMVIRAFGTHAHEKERFAETNAELTRVNTFVQRIMAMMFPMMTLIMGGTSILIVWIGAGQIEAAAMQVGDMMAFMQYATQIIMSFLMISMMFIMIPRAAVSADRVAEVLSTESVIKDPESPKPLDKAQKGRVEFRNVCFRYNGAEHDALSGISFTAVPGQTTAIIGSTGSGKSTIGNLIMRFHDVTEGQVLVDGIDVREASQKELRSVIGYVPQKGILHSGTIASNLRYGNRDATDDEVETAARVAQAMDFISEKENGIYSEISQGGANVSGGQKQRLAIARALAVNPEIFIFDDSFSALDFKTDAALRRELNAHTGDSTVVVVAQRVSTIMHAEQIIVLDKGRIVGRGAHSELLESCPEYYEIASSQMTKEEIA